MEVPPNLSKLRPLRVALLANAVFSLTTGIGLISFSAELAPWVGSGVPALLLKVIGAGLLPFGMLVTWQGLHRQPDTLIALAISLADLSWVAGSAVLLAFASAHLSALGIGLVIAVALFVLCFALGQLRGIARALAAGDSRARFRVCFDIRSQGSADVIWRNLADLGSIARFAPSLASSNLRAGVRPAVDAIRECTDRAGRQWAERCRTLDHERRELVMEFLTHEPGFPFPFVEMVGGWSVLRTTEGASVRVWWEGTPKHPLLNGLVLPLLTWQAQRQFPGMVQTMAGHMPTDSIRSQLLTVAPC